MDGPSLNASEKSKAGTRAFKPLKHQPDSMEKQIFEVKFAVPRHETGMLVSILRHNTMVPAHYSRAMIKTVYFDDERNTSFYESFDGEIVKRKYRLRVYMDREEGAYYSVEVKKRNDIRTSKVRELIFKELPRGYRITSFRSLIGELERITGRPLSRLRAELPASELLFDTVVFYDRLRFDDRHAPVRYNVDTSIKVYPHPAAVETLCGGMTLGHDIFEIKSGEPGVIPHFLKGRSLEPFSFSKFAWGKEYLT